jgi:hypothetical protein
MSALSPAALVLVKLMDELPRGPRRDSAFALWLTVRVVEDLYLVPPLPDKAVRRRVASLGERLSRLSLAAPLRRALGSAIAELGEPSPERATLALRQLIAPTRDILGKEAGEALSIAANRKAL